MATTEVYIHGLSGKKREIKEYARTIASMDAATCNSYVMGFDSNEETTFSIMPDMDKEEVEKEWKRFGEDTKRVEIYDHGFMCHDGSIYKKEEVYAANHQVLDRYLAKCKEVGMKYEIVENDSKYQKK